MKAASIVNNIALVKQRMGDEPYARFVASLPPPTQALVTRRILSVEWIEADEWLPFQEQVLRDHCGGDELAFRAIVRELCAIDFNGIYRFFLKTFVSPAFVVNRAAKVWDTYVEGGQLEVKDRRDTGVTVVLSVPPVSAIYFILVQGFIEELLHIAGGKDIQVTRESPDPTRCVYTASYR